ncbi:two component regulator with propeller domain [Maribacter vaceletii]|uniref:histidine kinase n=1 Tax=Maribacter vaceletii TaxID=1206816 RepID=A0A495EC19_9FLAO|nr:two-component regulator propeller domain-containing protein [Maribacter vaceletii]RKR14422.1 two component regulator with propeller domain [Maribacter vaceletii]
MKKNKNRNFRVLLKPTKYRLGILVVFIFFFSKIYCQESKFYSAKLNFKNITTKNGLSQRSVVKILQDNQGFIWFGTRYGLNKFNGTEFKVYNYSSKDSTSLSHNRITSLTLDKKGNIWVGTETGLNLYNPQKDNFTRIKKSKKLNTYYTSSIREVVALDTTYLWIATNKGLDKYNIQTKESISFSSFVKGGLLSNDITSILQEKKENLWICTTEKIQFFNAKNNTLKTYDYPSDNSPNVTKNYTTNLFKDYENNIWLGYNNGLAFFNNATKTFEDYTINDKKIFTTSVREICQDKQGYLWIGCYDGLYQLNLENKTINKYQNEVNNPKSLSQNSVYSIIEDDRGDLWVGTWAGGINYIDKNSNNFMTFNVGSTNKNLNYKVVSAIVEDKNENLWIATEGGGINLYDTKSQEFKFYTHDPNKNSSIITNNIKALIYSNNQNFWIGTHGKGLSYYNTRNNKFTHFENLKEKSNSIEDNKITSLVEDENSNIWIGTNKGGLNFFNTKLKTFEKIKDANQIVGSSIYTITKAKKSNTLYIGSQNGLSKVNIATKELVKINYKGAQKNTSFSVNQVISIYESNTNVLWIGTEGDGLYSYNLKTQESNNYGIKDGLLNEVIYGILQDNMQNIWVSTNKGISRINIHTKEVRNFDETDGLQGNEFNYGACLKTKKGNLVFGGTTGFTIFDPSKIIEKDTYVAPIEFTGFKVRNKPFLKSVDESEVINLTYDQNDFSIDFVALGFAHPKKHQFAYKLEGFDASWNFIGNKRTATYTNLNPGKYVFYLKASNGYGEWNKTPKKIAINIKNPYWKTWWAYLGYILIVTTLTLIIRKYTLLRIKDKNQLQQERENREKVEELNGLKLQLFTNISHDFRTPLTLIIGPLKRLLDKNTGDGVLQNQLAGMYRNANILLQLINQLLDFRKSESGKLKLSVKKRNIVPFLENIKLSFEELAQERNINYQFTSKNDNYNMWFDEIEMKKVILNILSNAFKFTPSNGKIIISISCELKTLKIVISDTGKGIREEDLPHVFDRYFQLGQHHELRSGTGVGLALAKDIVLLHHGEVLAESVLGKGTTFTILLPKGNSHFTDDQLNLTTTEFKNNLDISLPYNPSVVNIGWVNEKDEIQEVIIDEDLPTILHVEDNKEVRIFVKDIFKEEYNILEAQNGDIGLSIAQTNKIDIIISDVMMPKMDGLEFCNAIKSNVSTSHIPVLLLTARSSSKAQKSGFNRGADAYVTKPFDAEVLKMQVQNVLKSRKSLIKKFKKNILLEPKELQLESPDEELLKKVMSIVEENLSDSSFMAATLTEKVHMSQSVLYRKLKALTGQSISEFIRTIRLKRASQLLLQSNRGVAEIAYDVGFNDLKYFRRCFKKVFNATPSEYRKTKSIQSSSIDI